MGENILDDERYMHRCLQLALLARGQVSPNPMVGAVVVCDGKIIGEGYHRKYGEAHAEVNAIASVADMSQLSRSTLYVSLEPCSHYGKTPPCCDLVIAKKIPRVVIGVLDPFPAVSGRGVARLRAAGVDVEIGVLEEECKRVNMPFIVSQTQNRPFVLLKWAQSRDGFLDRDRSIHELPSQLSNAITRVGVHCVRAEMDAILVGTTTASKDNPSLTVRYWTGNDPLRLVIDRDLKLPQTHHLFSDNHPTVIYTAKEFSSTTKLNYVKLNFDEPILPQIIADLSIRKIQTLMVEGGANLLQQFIDAGLWDEARIEVAPCWLNGGVDAPVIQGVDLGFECFGENREVRWLLNETFYLCLNKKIEF